MRTRSLAWIAIALATGCTGPNASSSREVDGAAVYANNCGRCHEYRAPTEFNGPQWSIITTHMRVVGGIPADESRAVYEYLRAQAHPPFLAPLAPGAGAVPSTADLGQGRALVQQRGCVGCHVVEGQGGVMGPPLDGVTERRSAAFLMQQLRNPRANNPASLMPNLGLNDAEIGAIWAYLRTLGGADGR